MQPSSQLSQRGFGEDTSNLRMNSFPRAEQQNLVCFSAEAGFELRCTEVKNKRWGFFFLPFLYYKGFFSTMFLSRYSKPASNGSVQIIL